LTNFGTKLDGLKFQFLTPALEEVSEFLDNVGLGDKVKGLSTELLLLEDRLSKPFVFNRGGVEERVAEIRAELKRLADAREADAETAKKEADAAAERQRINNEYKQSLSELTGEYEQNAKAAESALAKETQELEAARQKQLNIEKEFADLRKNITAPEDENVSGLDVQLAILEAKTKLQQGQIQGAIESARDAGGLLESLKEGGEESGFVLSFLAKEIERVANAAAQKNVAAELVDKEQAEQAANTLKAQLQSLTEEAPKLGAEAGQAYIEAFQQALNAQTPTLPQPAAPPVPSAPIRRNGNSFSDGTDFNDAIEREGAK